MEIKELLKKAYDGSYYTIIGAGGNLKHWKEGYQKILTKQCIGTIKEWFTCTGKDMNETYELHDTNRYPDDLVFLMFPPDGLNIGKLAVFKLSMGDRWFDDIVDNDARREAEQ